MSKMIAICKKEINSYFLSPIAYILIGVFIMLSSFFFYMSTIGSGFATMEFVFGNMIFIFFLLTPILTMKLMKPGVAASS